MKRTKNIIIKVLIFSIVIASIGGFAAIVNESSKTPDAVCAHKFSEWKETRSTCTEYGNKYRTCSLCGEMQNERTGPLGHDLISHEGKNFTCNEAGWNAYESCSRCDYTTFEEIPAQHIDLGTLLGDVVQEVSCYDDGTCYEYLICNYCEVVISEEIVVYEKAYGHDWGIASDYMPECITRGECAIYCSTCGDEKWYYTSAEGHTFDENGACENCDENVSEGLAYVLSDDRTYYIITGIGTYNGTVVVIPSSINGIPVKKIGDEAFKDNENITRVDLPSSVETIGISAFENCIHAEIVFTEGLKNIQKRAFFNCYVSSYTLCIPSTVTYISYFAFGSDNGCCEVEEIIFLGTPLNINDEAFVMELNGRIFVPWSEDYDGSINDNAPWGASVKYSIVYEHFFV